MPPKPSQKRVQLCLFCLAAPLKLAATDTCRTRLHNECHSVVSLTKEAAEDEEADEAAEEAEKAEANASRKSNGSRSRSRG